MPSNPLTSLKIIVLMKRQILSYRYSSSDIKLFHPGQQILQMFNGMLHPCLHQLLAAEASDDNQIQKAHIADR